MTKRKKKALVAGDTHSTLSGLSIPIPGMWHFSWALVDRDKDCPTPWPSKDDIEYVELATWLAKLSEISLDEIFNEKRYSSKGATHYVKLEDIEEPWQDCWTRICNNHNLEADGEAVALASFTYCLADRDSRRIIMAYQPEARVLYPLWWDKKHQVSGTTRGYTEASPKSDHSDCHHIDLKLRSTMNYY